jgi:hypothetical protein
MIEAGEQAPEFTLPDQDGEDVSLAGLRGQTVVLYWNEGEHAQRHFHARYAGVAASVDFDGTMIAGSLPRRAHALVAEWAELHRDELLANWERARREESLELIEPLS